MGDQVWLQERSVTPSLGLAWASGFGEQALLLWLCDLRQVLSFMFLGNKEGLEGT